jgi:LmbE family N-acetylglucosaminyl deacetylase
MKRTLLSTVALLAVGVAVTAPRAQLRVVPVDEQQGHVALGLVLRHLANAGIVMEATAHPDDEDNGLLVMLNRGQGFRTALATATRGNGGQNEIGPEIFEALGVLRTQELAALHRFDGAEQYFTRAVDFGFSFSIDETFEKWGRDEITADYVRLIRMIRPDVIFALNPGGAGGGQHHQASAVIAHDAYRLAGDPTEYADQLKEGLRPWQPKKFYYTAGFGAPGEAPPSGKLVRINSAVYDPLLGKTYAEIGTEARSMHKCQGMAQLLALPGPSVRTYQLVESTLSGQQQRDERSLTDGLETSISSLAQLAGPRPPKDLVDSLAAIASSVDAAQKKFDGETDEAVVAPLLSGLLEVRRLRGALRELSMDDAAKYEIDFRLRQKEREFQQAVLVANGLRIEALADDGVVVPGEAVKVSVIVANNGSSDVTVRQVKFSGFDSDAACALTPVTAAGGRGGAGGGPGGGRGRGGPPAPAPPPISTFRKGVAGRCEPTLKVPATTRVSEPYWHRAGEAGRYTFDPDAPFGLPYRPTPFNVQVTLAFSGNEEVVAALPVQYRYEGNIFSGEKRSELLVVPDLSVRVSPEIAIIPVDALHGSKARTSAASLPRAEREVRVTVVNGSPAAAEGVVKLQLPAGWLATPAEQPVALSRADESLTLRFTVKPLPTTPTGEYHVRAVVTSNGRRYDRGYQVIEYPHIRRQHIYDDADVKWKVIDVKIAPAVLVGYIMGVGDQVPPAIEQLGAKLEFITADDLAWGNLSRFSVIVAGVRAYERRTDLRANNSRLLEYVRNGGTLIVQYNKFEFNDAQYGPYPAKVSNNRVTDERAAVTVLAPADPVFNVPNRITASAWSGWVQERGLYFLGDDHDSRYRELVELEDPFPYNKGPKRGALVEAAYGRGRWLYVGLGLWRELPAGVDGAYELLANLISLGSPAARADR